MKAITVHVTVSQARALEKEIDNLAKTAKNPVQVQYEFAFETGTVQPVDTLLASWVHSTRRRITLQKPPRNSQIIHTYRRKSTP